MNESQAKVDVGELYIALTYEDAPAAIEFLCKAFGFEPRLVVPGPDGKITHSELTLGRSLIMVSSPKPDQNRVGQNSLQQNGRAVSHSICLTVPDPDSTYEKAKSAGATIVQEIQDEDFGSRGFMATDCEGHLWYFGTYRPGGHWGK
jgi:uncharacterized glyoxalase superfamily protein PhnB